MMQQGFYGSVELKQSDLIEQIIEAVGFQHASGRPTPTDVAELPTDIDDPGPQESWSYVSVVGMLMYLAANSWPDITMAVQQWT
eukprot:9540400-Ditylum_brightwellii.AAC.1